ncbi:MAG: membrane protein insertase YidC [Gammaproteobacteria bacterium]|nr:MAG: membrane protein insertase YidC [Gammaproteobacteria bacterium]
MANLRYLLLAALALVALLLWQAWQQDYGRTPTPATTAGPRSQAAASERGPAAPAAGGDVPAGTPSTASPPPERPVPRAAVPHRKTPAVEVVTDLYRLEIDLEGGTLRRAELLRYPVSLETPQVPVRLLGDTPPDVFLAQSGLRSIGTEATHHVRFTAEQRRYTLAPGRDRLRVALHWTSPEGVEVTKRYTFHRGLYVIDLEQEVHNGGDRPWVGRQYCQLERSDVTKFKKHNLGIYTYTGGAIYSPEDKFQKLSFDDLAESPLSRDVRDGWVAFIQHYFLAAWIPDRGETDHYYSKGLGRNLYVLGLIGPQVEVPPGGRAVFHGRLFVGPKLQHQLARIAEGLDLTVDYGYLTILAKPIFWLLEKIHAVVGNWGWSIVILTLLIKLLFFKPSEMSYRSMAQMRRVAPRLKALQERYADDKQKLQQAMMELYRKEKINPLGGCLPVLIQIPVFIALYWVLLESVELRQSPWILWIRDLSTRDPYFVLPILYGLSMFVQQRLNPQPMDPVQQKMFMVMPFALTVMFAFFPSGLVLYWITNNLLSILQQWWITRRVEQAAAR